MNHLAHVVLSFNDPTVLVGNMLGDFYKSNRVIETLPQKIQNGIQLHRHIDSFTDSHPVVFESKARVRETFGKYASVAVDVYYDYCLSIHWEKFYDSQLQETADFAYKALLDEQEWLHPKLLKYLPIMIERNWLVQYQTFKGIQFTFNSLAKRAAYDKNFHLASTILKEHETDFLSDFDIFFPELIKSTRERYDELAEIK